MMDKNIDILGNLVNFLAVGLVFAIVLAVTFRILLKKYDFKTKKIKFYGLFLGMDNRSILAFSLITLNYIFLIWCTATFSGLNIYYICITVILMLLADIILKEYKRIFIDLIYSLINIMCIYVTSLLYNYLINEYTSIFMLIVLGLVVVFVFLYFTYITFKLLNNIVVKNDKLKKKKKRYKKI